MSRRGAHRRRAAVLVTLTALAPALLAGALAASSAPAARTSPPHGTHAGHGAAMTHEMGRGSGWVITGDPQGERLQLTTAQATKQLSRRCQRLIKARRPSRLSRADRRRRSACLRQRRALIAASASGPGATTPGSAAPASPTPTSPVAAAAPTPAPTATTPAAAPTTPTGPCAGKNPCYGAVGITARDDGAQFFFTLTRASVQADRVSFEFINADAQDHNLFIEEKGKPSTARAISTLLEPGGRVVKELALAPGTYQLRCLIRGHEAMVADFVVTAPVR